MVEKNSKGYGCLLAHCMGLGKTLQVIALIHTLLKNQNITKCNRVLILMPINVIRNWENEFDKWTRSCEYKIPVYEMTNDERILANEPKNNKRLKDLERWTQNGGVFLMGYTMFANLVHGKFLRNSTLCEKFKKCLVKPGPDLIICDEGHLLKNGSTNLALYKNLIF